MKLLILHLSDIHLRSDADCCISKFQAITPALQNTTSEIGKIIIVVSGDIAYSGSSSEYSIAFECLSNLRRQLQEKTNIEDVRFVFVPGNHDCNFKLDGGARETIISAIRKGISAPVDSGMIDLCCSVQKEFFSFCKSFSIDEPTRKENSVYWEYLIEDGGLRILLRCFNTAWLSQLHEQQGGLFYPDLYIGENEPKTKADYYVAVFHHPYNWLPASTYREFRSHIEKTSDLILTGHEHEPDHYQKYTFRGEVTEYLEGAVFQEAGHPERSGFHAIYLDLSAQRQKTVSFTWDSGLFVPSQDRSDWLPYQRGSRGGVRDFIISDDFNRWLDDPGASFTHPVKHGELSLSEIFVFPNLKEFRLNEKSEFIYGSLVEGRDVLKMLGAKKRCLIFGRQQAGKTTLAKVLIRDFYNKGITPIILSGDDISPSHLELEKFEEFVQAKFQEQYKNPLLPKFQQLDSDKTLLLIDDFDHTKLNPSGRLKFLRKIEKRYGRIFVFADDTIKLEEIASGKGGCEVLAEYDQFELVQFGYLLRSKLIEQWYSIGSEYVSNPEDLAKKIHNAETLITALLGKNYLPSYPVFILSLLQAHDSGNQLNANVGTYGGLYEVLIFQALVARSKGGNLDLKKTYLAELAYWMFSNEKRRISDENWATFHSEYCSKYKIRPSRQELKKDFIDTGLIEQLDQKFGFRHSYAYYYFVARYLRDNITQGEVRKVLESLCEKLDKQECASIWLFLTHLSKDPFLVEAILNHAKKIYARFQPANLDKDIVFLGDLGKAMEQVVLEDKDFEEIKEERLRKLDEMPNLCEEEETLPAENEEPNEVLKFISELNLALRTLEVLGQIVKNFPGSLIGADKFALVKEAYEVGLRTTGMLLGLYKDSSNDVIEVVVDKVLEQHPELSDKGKRAELEKNMKKFVFWMIELSCFGMLKRISSAVGHSQLNETYAEVLKAVNTNAVALIDVSVQLDNLGMPDDRLEELAKRFKDNVFCERLLRQMVVQHFYLFPTRESTKQKICALLDIPIKNLRGIDVQSRKEKLAPPKF